MMPTRAIWIGCPQHGRLVRGTYDCEATGQYLLDTNGEFLLPHVHCGQDGGRCAQPLCVLHRYNRGGEHSWYPSTILAGRQHTRPQPDRHNQDDGLGLF